MPLNADACDQLAFPAHDPGRALEFECRAGADIGAGGASKELDGAGFDQPVQGRADEGEPV